MKYKKLFQPKTQRISCLLFIVMMLAGCQMTPSVKSNISSFSVLPYDLTGKSIHVLASNSKKNCSLEWKAYRTRFEDGFHRSGLTLESEKLADYIAYVSYSIDEGKPAHHFVKTPVYGYVKDSNHNIFTSRKFIIEESYNSQHTPNKFLHEQFHNNNRQQKYWLEKSCHQYQHSTLLDPTSYHQKVVGYELNVIEKTVYTRMLTVDIYKGASTQNQQPIKVYEGTLRSVGSASQLKEVMNELIDSFFQKFPRGSGKVNIRKLDDLKDN